jgi:hypothetical protein
MAVLLMLFADGRAATQSTLSKQMTLPQTKADMHARRHIDGY